MSAKQKVISLVLALIMLASVLMPAFISLHASAEDDTSVTETVEEEENKKDEKPDEKEIEKDPYKAKSKIYTIDERVASYSNPNGRVLSMAKEGAPRLYPENSLEGIQYCIDAGIDIVSVSVQETQDHQLVLFKDSDIKRMLCDINTKKPVSGKVSNITLNKLQTEYLLREGHGGKRKASKYTVPSMKEALQVTNKDVIIYVENGWKYKDQIQDLARSLNVTPTVIIGGATNPDKIKSFITDSGGACCKVSATYSDGKTESSAKNFTKDCLASGASSVMLSSDKEYSSIFKRTVMKLFSEKGRAIISTTRLTSCGEHKDNITGWEELIETGYSVIETDYPRELSAYLHEVENYRATLTNLITQAQTLTLGNYSKDTARALEKSLEESETIAKKGTATLAEMDDARYELQESIDSLEYGEPLEKKTLPIWLKLIIIIACIAAGIFVIMLVLRYINKNKAAKKESKEIRDKYKKISEKNLANAETNIDGKVKPINAESKSENIIDHIKGEESEKPTKEPEKPEPKKFPDTKKQNSLIYSLYRSAQKKKLQKNEEKRLEKDMNKESKKQESKKPEAPAKDTAEEVEFVTVDTGTPKEDKAEEKTKKSNKEQEIEKEKEIEKE